MIGALAEANPNLAVVIVSGNAVAMPWIGRVPAVLEAWFSGSEAGNALADVVFGAVNPSGKLPFTFPVRLEDNSAHALGEYPGGDTVTYNESIFVGYRWHDKERLEPLFAFGHGLSYTTFAVGNVKADRTTLASKGSIRISADVTNTATVRRRGRAALYRRRAVVAAASGQRTERVPENSFGPRPDANCYFRDHARHAAVLRRREGRVGRRTGDFHGLCGRRFGRYSRHGGLRTEIARARKREVCGLSRAADFFSPDQDVVQRVPPQGMPLGQGGVVELPDALHADLLHHAPGNARFRRRRRLRVPGFRVSWRRRHRPGRLGA